jgi:hypothetical protein
MKPRTALIAASPLLIATLAAAPAAAAYTASLSTGALPAAAATSHTVRTLAGRPPSLADQLHRSDRGRGPVQPAEFTSSAGAKFTSLASCGALVAARSCI